MLLDNIVQQQCKKVATKKSENASKKTQEHQHSLDMALKIFNFQFRR
jgi:hypothetical protein